MSARVFMGVVLVHVLARELLPSLPAADLVTDLWEA